VFRRGPLGTASGCVVVVAVSLVPGPTADVVLNGESGSRRLMSSRLYCSGLLTCALGLVDISLCRYSESRCPTRSLNPQTVEIRPGNIARGSLSPEAHCSDSMSSLIFPGQTAFRVLISSLLQWTRGVSGLFTLGHARKRTAISRWGGKDRHTMRKFRIAEVELWLESGRRGSTVLCTVGTALSSLNLDALVDDKKN
jgi:hypothetical protein